MHNRAIAICEEYLPEFSIATKQGVDTRLAPCIFTIVSYDKFSELSMRLFEIGFVVDDFDGSVFKLIEHEDGSLEKSDPALAVIFKPAPPAKIDVSCSGEY